jgi:hypothetical protein
MDPLLNVFHFRALGLNGFQGGQDLFNGVAVFALEPGDGIQAGFDLLDAGRIRFNAVEIVS